MLIEFKVANYRSIRDEQIFSLVANNYDKSLLDNLIVPNLAGLSKVKLLKGAAVYGPNASGKSNIMSAFTFMVNFVANSTIKIAPNEPTGTVPFCLDAESKQKPSSFEIMASIDGVRYTYGFALTSERVWREHLIAYPKGSAQNWFVRTYNSDKNEYSWDHSLEHFKLDKDLCEKTRPNSLFVSTGAQFNNAQLTIVYNWFSKGLKFLKLDSENMLAPITTASLFKNDAKIAGHVQQLLHSADFGITATDISHEDIALDEIRDHIAPEVFRKMEADAKRSSLRVPRIKFKHHAVNIVDQDIDYNEESAGTRRFFSLIGPWLDILDHGYTVIIDELETSLHPILVKEFLKLLFSATYNPKGAQIVFTIHNPILLDTEVIRRDQIWFTEKDEHGATRLYPLTDYKPRKNESLSRGYLAGRYGAIPFIPEGLRM